MISTPSTPFLSPAPTDCRGGFYLPWRIELREWRDTDVVRHGNLFCLAFGGRSIFSSAAIKK